MCPSLESHIHRRINSSVPLCSFPNLSGPFPLRFYLDKRVGEWHGKKMGILTTHRVTAPAMATVITAFTVHRAHAETVAGGLQEDGVKGVNQLSVFTGHLPKDKQHDKTLLNYERYTR